MDWQAIYDYDETYPLPKPSKRIAPTPKDKKNSNIEGQQYITHDLGVNGIGPLHTLAPERLRIQSFHSKFLNNSVLADFANKHMGGGTLRSGSVQEEMVFSEYFECCLPMGFSQTMHPSATISIVGVVNHAILGGYASRSFLSKYMTFDDNLWTWQYQEAQKLNQKGKMSKEVFQSQYPLPTSIFTNYTSIFPVSNILAFDSTPYGSAGDQFRLGELKRQFTKITSGLTSTLTTWDMVQATTTNNTNTNTNQNNCPDTRIYTPTTFISGNWGCGVFGATPSWIYQLQMMICNALDVSLRYLSVGDQRCVGAHQLSMILSTFPQFSYCRFLFQKMLAQVNVNQQQFFNTAWDKHQKLMGYRMAYNSSVVGIRSTRSTVQLEQFIQLIKSNATPLGNAQRCVCLRLNDAAPLDKCWEATWQNAYGEPELIAMLNQQQRK